MSSCAICSILSAIKASVVHFFFFLQIDVIVIAYLNLFFFFFVHLAEHFVSEHVVRWIIPHTLLAIIDAADCTLVVCFFRYNHVNVINGLVPIRTLHLLC